MDKSAWHLFVTAWRAAVDLMGTTTLAIAFGLVVYMIVLLKRVFFGGGLKAVKSHFLGDAGLTAATVVSGWSLLIVWCLIVAIYKDHTVLVNRNAELNAAINGPTGYKQAIQALTQQYQKYQAEIDAANAKTTSAQNKPPKTPNIEADRGIFLTQLTKLYMASHNNITPEMLSGFELPPVAWLNQQLEKQNKNWRIRSVNGAVANTYSLAPQAIDSRTPRDPNALYQFGELVGNIQGAVLTPEHSRISFQQVILVKQVDLTKPFEYQDWVLNCKFPPDTDDVPTLIYRNVITAEYAHCDLVSRNK